MESDSIETINRDIILKLTSSLGNREAKSAARMILEDLYGITPTDLAVNGQRRLEPFTISHIHEITDRICAGEPVQYAIGTARFYGMDFIVNPSVLIPRPETEGLVDMIVNDNNGRNDLHVLDCGTGSGCIAVSLARNLPFARVDAFDISDDAIKVAKANAEKLKTYVNIFKCDMRSMDSAITGNFDIIVSNPPYIANSEIKTMDNRVKLYEPSLALFVPDSDPLIYYRLIAMFAKDRLTNGGRLYFEINPLFRTDLVGLLKNIGFDDIDSLRDYIGNYRFIKASISS